MSQPYLLNTAEITPAQFKKYLSLHYIIASFVFAIYGIQVCPLLENISPFQLILPTLIVLIIRLALVPMLSTIVNEKQVTSQFYLDLGLFFLAALLLNAINVALYDAPLESNLKVIVGMSVLGLFVALDLSLLHERHLAVTLIRKHQTLDVTQRFTSFSKKFLFMASLVVISMSIVFFLVVNKDLVWLIDTENPVSLSDARSNILTEIAFVMVILLAYCIRVIKSYVLNLNMYLSHQNSVLTEVMDGNMNKRVPVTSHDEFGFMAQGTNAMIDSLKSYQDELQLTRDVSVLALASLAETRDNETGAHILRTQRYVKVLAENLSTHPDFDAVLTVQEIDLLYKSAPLHDVGKVGIPDSILLKPGKLTDDEFVIMKGHAQLGADSLEIAEAHLGSNSFLKYAREIAACHHEKWDGSGYPNGSRGDDIPLSARLMALADVYDALISKRVYKPAFDHEKAKAIILDGDGSHFDPRIIQAFLECENDFIQIAADFKDRHEQA
jgi:response regulator RpfG family c-di-GMP phosphodiesterase